MTLDYTTALSRTRAYLMDAGSMIWTDGDLTGCLRLALQVAGLYAGSAYTLSGLDGAASTSLPAPLEGALIVGAAAYAAGSRAVDRAEAYELNGESAALDAWADRQLREWVLLVATYVEQTRLTSLRTLLASPNGIYAAWGDDFGERSGEK